MHTSLTALPHAVRAATSSGGGGSSLVPFVVLVALFALAYLLFLRPARNRQRAAAQQKRNVNVGDEVTTTAGLIATVVAVEDDMLTLEVAPGVHCRYVPAAVLRVNGPEVDTPEAAEAPDIATHEVIDPTEGDDDLKGTA